MDKEAAKDFILQELMTGLPGSRTYHSVEHTLDVYESAVRIAKQEGVRPDELDLIETAALFHDSGFLVMPRAHEQGSCLLAREHLPHFGFSEEQVSRICSLIMATTVPQVPGDRLGQILCDADLDYLGRPDFPVISERLYNEMRTHGAVIDRLAWNRIQEAFLAKHEYQTESSKREREPLKQKHLAGVRQWLEEHR